MFRRKPDLRRSEKREPWHAQIIALLPPGVRVAQRTLCETAQSHRKWYFPVVMRRTLRFGVLACSFVLQLVPCANAQVPTSIPQFEVASVKPCAKQSEPERGARRGDGGHSSPDRLHLPCQTLLSLVRWGYVNFAEG